MTSQLPVGSALECPRCHSHNVRVQAVEKVQTERRGFFAWILWIVFALVTCGLFLLIVPLVTNSKTFSTTQKLAICQNCGHTWNFKRPRKPINKRLWLWVGGIVLLLALIGQCAGANDNQPASAPSPSSSPETERVVLLQISMVETIDTDWQGLL